MDQAKLEALLGRPLTDAEATNRELYLNIAQQSLEELLCISLEEQTDGATATDRVYRTRDGYSTVFTDIFTGTPTVTVSGGTQDDAYAAFWDDRNSNYYNSVVLDCRAQCEQDVTVTAVWGFATLPDDLQMLLAQQFAVVAARKSTKRVKSKRVEDFSITFADITDDQEFLDANRRVIAKYRMCDVGYVKHGRVC